jgi:hypothetical protein
VFVGLLSFVSSNALAQTKIMLMPVIPVGEDVSKDAAVKMYQAIREELESRPGVLVIDGKYPKSRTRGTARRGRTRRAAASLATAEDRLDEGRRQSQKLRFARAIQPLKDALDIFGQNIAKLESYDGVLEAHLLLSEAYLRRGKQRDGVAVVERLLTLVPALELDPRNYPPMFLGLVEQARDKVVKRQRGVLRVVQGGEREQVFLNGRPMGRTPLRVEAVVPGEHHVRVTSPGKPTWGLKVVVKPGEETVAEDPNASTVVRAEGALETIKGNVFDQSVRGSVRTAARKRGADFVIVTGMGAKMGLFSCAGFLGDVRSRTWSQIRTVSPDMDLLSAGIEAGTYVTSVTGLIKKPGAGMRGDQVAFVSGLGNAGRGRSMPEKRVTFVTDAQIAAAIAASKPKRVAPIARDARTPDPSSPPAKVELLPEEAFAEKAGLTKLDLTAEVSEDDGLLGKWWFWTSVGVSVAAVVTAALVTSEGEPTGVLVRASW